MATEFSLAVVRLDRKYHQDRLMNSFDVIVETSNTSANQSVEWDIENEAIRRGIFCWNAKTAIDVTVNGLPGKDSYVSVPKAIDSVLGMISEANAEDHVLDTSRLSKEIEWDMNMQSQEWMISEDNWMIDRAKVQSVFGDIYAYPHHFETLSYLKMPIERQRCIHKDHEIFNENIFSTLHHITHNTIYMIDTSYKVIVLDQKPYRFPLGLICEYVVTKQLDEWKRGKFFSDSLIANEYNASNIAEKMIYIENDVEVDYNKDSQLQHKVHIIRMPKLNTLNNEAFVKTEHDDEYDNTDSKLIESPMIINNPIASDVQIKKLTYQNNKISVTHESNGIEDVQGSGANDVYANMLNRGNDVLRREVIKYTNVKYTESGVHTVGYGPLTVEGEVTSGVFEQWKRDDKMKDFVNFLQWEPQRKIDPNKLCYLFSDYSRKHPSANVAYKDDDEICAKFRLTLNALYNNGEDKAEVASGYGEGWTIDPIDVEAFANIDKVSQPAYKKNTAKLGIVIASVMGGIITELCPIHAIRGAFLLANKMYGNVYNLLEETFKWRIWIAEKRPGWFKQNNERISPLVRFDVYRATFKKGWSGVSWQFYWDDDLYVKAEGGYPFYQEEVINSCKFEEDKVIKYVQDVINTDDWSAVHVEIDNLLNDEGQFRAKDVLNDFYLDKYRVLVTPWYYGVKVYYNVIANCCYKCVPVTANDATPSNKNQFKHSGGQRLLVPNNWFYPFQDQYDDIVICEGNSLSNVRQPRGRLERTYIDSIAQNSDYRDYVGKDEVDIVDTGCPIAYTTSYVIWFYYVRLFNIYVNFFPIDVRKKFQKNDDDIPVFPNFKMYQNGFTDNIKSLNEAVYQLFIDAYGAKELRSTEKNVWIKRYQTTSGEVKLKLIKDAIPALYNQLVGEGDLLDNYFVINFLLLLSVTSTNTAIDEDVYVPICYCRSKQLSIFSVKITSTRKSNIMSQFICYLTRFYGLAAHSNWKGADDVTRLLRRKAIEYYVGKCIVNLVPDMLTRQTKHQNINLWIGTKCDGFSDVLIFYQAITHPRASYFVLCLCPYNTNLTTLKIELFKMLSSSSHTSSGFVIIRIKKDHVLDIHVEGDLHARQLRRNFWGLNHDVVLIKSKGKVFGNKHLVTKLMNIQS
uniref:Outer capsid protein VP2 n=1 Tax=Changuinola virus TaxID=40052 RepID=U5YL21_9REOV|nr:outer capsid protein VP2 [Changuinola virus]